MINRQVDHFFNFILTSDKNTLCFVLSKMNTKLIVYKPITQRVEVPIQLVIYDINIFSVKNSLTEPSAYSNKSLLGLWHIIYI